MQYEIEHARLLANKRVPQVKIKKPANKTKTKKLANDKAKTFIKG